VLEAYFHRLSITRDKPPVDILKERV
jgi:hypothetical protein